MHCSSQDKEDRREINMKRACLILLFAVLLIELFSVKIFADQGTDMGLSEILTEEEAERAGDELIEFLSPTAILERLIGTSREALGDCVPMLCAVSGTVILCALCRALSDSLSSRSLCRTLDFVGSAAVIAAVLGTQATRLSDATEYFERLGALMNSMIPIGATVLAMGGNVSTASVGSATLYAMLAVTEKICSSTVLPVCTVMGAAAVCAGLSDGAYLDGFCGAVKKIYNFILGIVMTVFVFALGAQTSITAAADTAAARSGKFLTSVLIPGVGGAVGETVRTLAGSVGYIKNVVGVGGIVIVAVITLPVLISFLLTRLVFLLTSTLAGMLGCTRECKLLSELGNIYAFLVGAVSLCAVAFVVALALFLKCTVAIE